MLFNDLLYGGAGLIGLLVALASIIITIALIVAIFQINGRIGDLIKLQQRANTHLVETAELQRQTFIALLAEDGPNHEKYLDYLVDQGHLSQYQADFILLQSGQYEFEDESPEERTATEEAFLDLVNGDSK